MHLTTFLKRTFITILIIASYRASASDCIALDENVSIASSVVNPSHEDFPVVLMATGLSNSSELYFEWSDETGAVIDTGIGLNSISIVTKGTFFVKVAYTSENLLENGCYIEDQYLIGIRSLVASDDQYICWGDRIELKARGMEGDINWESSSSNLEITEPNSTETSVIFDRPGKYTFNIKAEVLSDNVVYDGKFDNYNDNWNADLLELPFETTYEPAGGGNGDIINGPNQLRVASNIAAWAPGYHPCEDDTNFFTVSDLVTETTIGRGKFLYADANESPDIVSNPSEYALSNYVWQQSNISVESNTNYTLRFEFAEWNDSYPGTLMVLINGEALTTLSLDGEMINASEGIIIPAESCNWFNIQGDWFSADTTTVTITIAEVSGLLMGGEFALDNISLSTGRSIQHDQVNVTVSNCFELEAREDTTVCIGDFVPLFNQRLNGYQMEWNDLGESKQLPTGNQLKTYPRKPSLYESVVQFPIHNFLDAGDFETNELGFQTDLDPIGRFRILNLGQYIIDTVNSAHLHISMKQNLYDHTSGTSEGRYLLTRFQDDQALFRSSFPAIEGEKYVFSFWFQDAFNGINNYSVDNYSFDVLINGDKVDELVIRNEDDWKQYSYIWTQNSTQISTIELVARRAHYEAALALDDISIALLGNELRDTIEVKVEECFDILLSETYCSGDTRYVEAIHNVFSFGWYDSSDAQIDSLNDLFANLDEPETFTFKYGIPFENWISNGGFENGNDGSFTSVLTYSNRLSTYSGEYTIDTSSEAYTQMEAITSNGKFLVLLPSNESNEAIYASDTFAFTADNTYQFKVDLAYLSSDIAGGSHDGFSIYLGDSLMRLWKPSISNNWQNLTFTWIQRFDNQTSIKIVNNGSVLNSGGIPIISNGIGIDNVSLSRVEQVGQKSITLYPCGPFVMDTTIRLCANTEEINFDLSSIDDEITDVNENSTVNWFITDANSLSNPQSISPNVLITSDTTFYTKVSSTELEGSSYSRLYVELLPPKNPQCLLTDIEDSIIPIRIYPNPTSSSLYIDAVGFERLELINFMGHTIVKANLPHISVDGLDQGVYNLIVHYSGQVYKRLVVIE